MAELEAFDDGEGGEVLQVARDSELDRIDEILMKFDHADPFEKAVVRAKLDEAELLLQKHRDYGPTNISRSPGGPLNGLAVRLWDKIARMHNLGVLNDAGAVPQFESLRDTGLDIANYGTIATLVVDGDWPA